MVDFEDYKALLKTDRSIRRFNGSKIIGEDILKKLVELTRYCASGRNLQPLRYRLVVKSEEMKALFPALKWACYYTDWDGPSEDERPAAYMVQCIDADLAPNCLCDDGLQLQAITLGATSMGIGCCIIKAFNVIEVAKALCLPNRYKPLYVLALGYPAEDIFIEETDGTTEADIRYYRDASGGHHVPKRPLEELIL